ncbi:MAG TPA: hypothetical protein VK753_12135, partial [Xanthomonadaceae bacterium]|nr:hypothetical protein [Xanthomonadaceae bacterium]
FHRKRNHRKASQIHKRQSPGCRLSSLPIHSSGTRILLLRAFFAWKPKHPDCMTAAMPVGNAFLALYGLMAGFDGPRGRDSPCSTTCCTTLHSHAHDGRGYRANLRKRKPGRWERRSIRLQASPRNLRNSWTSAS